jgi:hypothetical protein
MITLTLGTGFGETLPDRRKQRTAPELFALEQPFVNVLHSKPTMNTRSLKVRKLMNSEILTMNFPACSCIICALQ